MDIFLLTGLLIFNLLFFWKIWLNPFILSRSELLSTFFPSWLYIGRQIRKGESWKYEPCYWLNFHAHPVLSSYYPPNVLTAWIGAYLSLDSAFVLLTRTLLLHFVLQSFLWYWLLQVVYSPLIALFGSVILTYGAYQMKQQPCIVYTLTWFPLALNTDPMLSALGVGLILLAGYYPLAIYLIPTAIIAQLVWHSNLWCALGFLIGFPQIITFMRYLPKTIRQKTSSRLEVGKHEKSWYIGILPGILALFSTSSIWPLFILSLVMSRGYFGKYLPRIHERWLVLTQFSLGWMAISGLSNLNLPNNLLLLCLFLACFDLLQRTSRLLPMEQCELWQRPARAFKSQMLAYIQKNIKPDERVSGLPYPLFTGIINNIKTLGYCGGMQLSLMAKWRNDNDPNGGGEHDWFRRNQDSESLDRSRVRFSFSCKELDRLYSWKKTPFKRLWENPRLT